MTKREFVKKFKKYLQMDICLYIYKTEILVQEKRAFENKITVYDKRNTFCNYLIIKDFGTYHRDIHKILKSNNKFNEFFDNLEKAALIYDYSV